MLPFITPPAPLRTRRIGNTRCGVVELEQRGGLTVAEDDLIAELQADDESAFVVAAKAAEAIAAAEGSRSREQPAPAEREPQPELTIVEAFEIIRQTIAGETLDPAAYAVRLRHAETIQHVATVFARSGQRNMEAGVTALIRCRLQRPTWTMEDTRGLDRVLFRGIHQLLLDEQSADSGTPEPVTEEEVGKPRAASGGGRKRTGRKSSGSSAVSTQDSSAVLALPMK